MENGLIPVLSTTYPPHRRESNSRSGAGSPLWLDPLSAWSFGFSAGLLTADEAAILRALARMRSACRSAVPTKPASSPSLTLSSSSDGSSNFPVTFSFSVAFAYPRSSAAARRTNQTSRSSRSSSATGNGSYRTFSRFSPYRFLRFNPLRICRIRTALTPNNSATSAWLNPEYSVRIAST